MLVSSRRAIEGVLLVLGGLAVSSAIASFAGAAEPGSATRYARFEHAGRASYGLVEGDRVRRLEGDLLGQWSATNETIPLAEVKLLVPVVPNKVFAVGLNYRSHIGDRPVPKVPEIFYKLPTSVVGPEEPIVLPRNAEDVHYEGELVVVIGKRGRDLTAEQAGDHILGVTCGNDVSARQWQKGDLQWWRAKGSDTFGPCGPILVSGIDYDDLLLTLRHNGEVKQQQRTSDLVHGVRQIVAWISQHVTIEPGDLVFTGTPGMTTPLADGDVVEVEIEQIGVLRNPVRQAR